MYNYDKIFIFVPLTFEKTLKLFLFQVLRQDLVKALNERCPGHPISHFLLHPDNPLPHVSGKKKNAEIVPPGAGNYRPSTVLSRLSPKWIWPDARVDLAADRATVPGPLLCNGIIIDVRSSVINEIENEMF